jgi:hypothetical protein
MPAAGAKGIDQFFVNHRCNGYCHAEWQRPRAPERWFADVPGTTMLPAGSSDRLQLERRSRIATDEMLGRIPEDGEEDDDGYDHDDYDDDDDDRHAYQDDDGDDHTGGGFSQDEDDDYGYQRRQYGY